MYPLDISFATSSNWYRNQVIRNLVWLSKLEVVKCSFDEWDLLVCGDHGQLVLVEPDSLLAVFNPCPDEHVEVEFLDICDEIFVEELLDEVVSSVLVLNVKLEH